MSKSIWDQINEKVKRKKDLKEEIASRPNNVEQFVLDMVNEIDETLVSTVNTSLAPVLAAYHVKSLHERMKTIDTDVEIEIIWQGDGKDGNLPRIDGVVINWSKEYQEANNCEAQLFISVASLLFK